MEVGTHMRKVGPRPSRAGSVLRLGRWHRGLNAAPSLGPSCSGSGPELDPSSQSQARASVLDCRGSGRRPGFLTATAPAPAHSQAQKGLREVLWPECPAPGQLAEASPRC